MVKIFHLRSTEQDFLVFRDNFFAVLWKKNQMCGERWQFFFILSPEDLKWNSPINITTGYKKRGERVVTLFNREITARKLRSYTWERTIKYCQERNIMLIKITEKYGRRPSNGGTSLTLIAQGRSTIDYCRVQDHFNGNYTAMCPIHEGSVRITTNINFLAYNVFTSNKTALNQTILKPIVVSKYMDERKAKSLRTRTDYRTCRKWNVSEAVNCGACDRRHHGISGMCHTKRSVMTWVVVIPKEGWAHRLFNKKKNSNI